MSKRPKPVDLEKLVDDLHRAVRTYVEGCGGKVLIIGPIEIVRHKPTSFDVVVSCVGSPPHPHI
jgi:hypothetical protein